MTEQINLQLLKSNIDNMLLELQEYIQTDITESQIFILKQKYEYILSSSPTLFTLLINNYKNLEYLKKNISVILFNLEEIQNKHLSEYNASVNVGTHFANEYFPKNK